MKKQDGDQYDLIFGLQIYFLILLIHFDRVTITHNFATKTHNFSIY